MSLLENSNVTGTAERLLDSAKRNPEGVLLLAAGAALLLRRTGAVSGRSSRRTNGHYHSASHAHAGQSTSGDASTGEHGMTESVRSYASDVAGRVTRSAGGVADYTSSMARTAMDRSSRIAHDTGSTMRGAMDRMLDEQPLTLALFGLAAGAILATALPATRMERNALGPVGKKMNEAAEEAGTRLKKSAGMVGERLTEMADEHGLNAKGLRDTAREVAQTFSEGMTGNDQQQQGGQQSSTGGQVGQQSSAGGQSGQKSSTGGLGGQQSSGSGAQRSAGGQDQQQASAARSATNPPSTTQSSFGSSSSAPERSGQGASANTPPSGRMS